MSAQRAIAVQLRKLASDPASQTFICQEASCLSGLLSLLNSPDSTETLLISLQALLFLSSHPQCKDALLRQSGLVVRLTVLTEHEDEKVKAVVGQVLGQLQAAVNREKTDSGRKGAGPRRVGRYLHSIALQVRTGGEGGRGGRDDDDDDEGHMLSAEERGRLEKAVIVVNGVISVSVSSAGLLTVYTKRDDDEQLRDAIASAVRNINQAWTLSLSQTNSGASHPANKENIPLASLCQSSSSFSAVKASSSFLLSSSSSSSSSVSSSSCSSHSGGSRALVAASTVEQNSLQSRFQARQRKAAEADNKQGVVKSLFSSVSSFFW